MAHHESGGVMSCSALKRNYRDQLRHHAPSVEFLHLHGSPRGDRPASGQPARPLHAGLAAATPSSRPSSRSPPTSTAQSSTSTRASTRSSRPTSTSTTPGAAVMNGALMSHRHPRDAAPLVEPVAAGWQLVARRPAGHRPDRRADHLGQGAPVPGADPRRPHRRHRRRARTSTTSSPASPPASVRRPRGSAR